VALCPALFLSSHAVALEGLTAFFVLTLTALALKASSSERLPIKTTILYCVISYLASLVRLDNIILSGLLPLLLLLTLLRRGRAEWAQTLKGLATSIALCLIIAGASYFT